MFTYIYIYQNILYNFYSLLFVEMITLTYFTSNQNTKKIGLIDQNAMISSKYSRNDYIDVTYNQSKYKNIVVKAERYHKSKMLSKTKTLEHYHKSFN